MHFASSEQPRNTPLTLSRTGNEGENRVVWTPPSAQIARNDGGIRAAARSYIRLETVPANYDVMRRAIGHIRGHWREQPEIETVAEAAGVTQPSRIICFVAGPASHRRRFCRR
jgi:hypothetical protein